MEWLLDELLYPLDELELLNPLDELELLNPPELNPPLVLDMELLLEEEEELRSGRK